MIDSEALRDLAVTALEGMKGVDIVVLDVRRMTSVADYMVVASGTSDRHVRALAESVVADAKQAGLQPGGVEGAEGGEWVLVDLFDVVVHVMQPRVRDFYALERLWSVGGDSPQTDGDPRSRKLP